MTLFHSCEKKITECKVFFPFKITKTTDCNQEANRKTIRNTNRSGWSLFLFRRGARISIYTISLLTQTSLRKRKKNVTFVTESEVEIIIKIELDEARVNKIISGCLFDDDNNGSKCIHNNSTLMFLWFMWFQTPYICFALTQVCNPFYDRPNDCSDINTGKVNLFHLSHEYFHFHWNWIINIAHSPSSNYYYYECVWLCIMILSQYPCRL